MRRERGVAAVTALLIVAVAASAAILMLSQQSAMLDRTLMVAGRAQADLHAQAGLDWARGVLLADAREAKDVDALGEGWARPIAGLPVERAVVAGAITDEQGKFNLNNLASGSQRSAGDERLFRALLASLSLPPELADAAIDWIDADGDLAGGGGAEDSYYLALARPYRASNRPMAQVEELYRVRGFDAAAVAKLRPYVTALPTRTAINVNTAAPLLLSLATGVDAERIAPLAAKRVATPFRNAAEFAAALGEAPAPLAALDVRSAHYLVRVQVAQDDVRLASEALLRRDEAGMSAVLWRRPLY